MTAKIKLNATSGGGSVSIQAPSSSSNDRVIALPDIADGTLVTSESTLDATKLSGNLPAISGASLTNIPKAASTPNVGGTGHIGHAVANNLTYSNVTGNYLLGNVASSVSASTIYGLEVYVELHHHSSSASHGYLGGWLYQTGKTYNVDGAYFQNNMYNAYSTALRFTYLIPWDPSGTQSLSLYITSSLETGTNNYFNIGVQNKLENV